MFFKPQTPAEALMYTVKRIEACAGGRRWVGTGYAYEHKSEENSMPLLVTNRHVVDGADKLRVLLHVAVNGVPDGGYVYIDLTRNNSFIFTHPDPEIDLAVIGLGKAISEWIDINSGRTICWQPLYKYHIAADDFTAQLDACEEVIMVGCPSGLWDEFNGFPLFRRGITASHPAIDFNGRPEFVVDIGVYSGSSGSPVFILQSGMFRPNKAENSFSAGTRFSLLGTLWGGPRITEQGELVVVPAPTDTQYGIQTNVRMHLGYVIKAREILVMIDALLQHWAT